MSDYATANGIPMTSLRLCIPREGNWTGDLSLQDGTPIDINLKINVNEMEFIGTAIRIGNVNGSTVARFVGGKGGLGKAVKTKMYNNVSVRLVLGDILGAAEEGISNDATPAILNRQLNKWVVTAGNCGLALNTLVKLNATGATWRMNTDGTVWVGTEEWQEAGADGDILLDDAMNGRLVMHMPFPGLIPGRKLNGRKVSCVEHELKRDSTFLSTVIFEASAQ